MGDLGSRLKSVDVFPKINEAFSTRTLAGGLITIVSSAVMLMLFMAECRLMFVPHTQNVLSVDKTRGAKLQVQQRLFSPS